MIKSIYKLAAQYGLYLGLALIVLWLSMAWSLQVPGLSLLAVGIFLAVPVLVYFMLRKSYRINRCGLTFSALWMEGICIFFFGCLLMAVAVFVFLKYINPEFVITQLQTASDFYASQGGELMEVSDAIDKIIESGQVPTPIEIAIQFIWLGVFTGSLLSMLLAFIVRKTTKTY